MGLRGENLFSVVGLYVGVHELCDGDAWQRYARVHNTTVLFWGMLLQRVLGYNDPSQRSVKSNLCVIV